MKRLQGLLFIVFLAACRAPGASTASSGSLPAPVHITENAPVFVPAICTLMGNPVRTEVPVGHPVIVIWGWSAGTQEQVEDYIQASIVVVTFDGGNLQGVQQGDIPYDETAKIYRAAWTSNIGIPERGLHVITYSLTFSRKIFDGTTYYGPGTGNERQEDRCEIDVK
jgi:hypothetical protein